MQNNLLIQARQNWLIAIVRLFQACFCLASILVQPDAAGGFQDSLRQILLAYLGVAVLGCMAAQFWRGRHETLFLSLLAVDGLVLGAVLALTAGSGGAFFALFLLIVLSATLQWGWRGAAGATATALAAFLATGLPAYLDLTGFQLDRPQFILRAGAVLSLGGVLIVYGRHQERITSGMLGLFAARSPAEASGRPPTFDCLELATSVFGVDCAAFVWGDPEEPGLHVDQLAPHGRTQSAWPVSAGNPVADGIKEPFFFDGRKSAVVSLGRDGRMRREPAEALNSRLLDVVASDLTLVAPVSASRFSGWIILSPFPSLDREALILGGVVATQASAAIEAWRALAAWRDAAGAEERVRLARDLHDGTLQFMAGTAMQLAALSRELGPRQKAARERVQRLMEDLRSEQRQLRVMIDSTSSLARAGSLPAQFRQEVQSLTAVLARRWSTDITVQVEPPADRELPSALTFELLQIVREAISNAVRHGKASTVSIHADSDWRSFKLTIRDNGIGMPVRGVFDMQELRALATGPRMLQSRVTGLGGDLVLESASSGTTLKITAPLRGAQA